MISVSGRNWKLNITNKNLVEKIKQDYNFSSIVSKLVTSRKFDENELAGIKNNLYLNNVFLENVDFNESVKVLFEAINNKDYICILGDYDVDGSAATSLFVRFFETIKHPFFYYIPDREKDGYGASKKLFKKLILKKPKLIIMVDCGSSSNEAIDFLNINNIKSLIIDHHEIIKPFPKANVIINPKKDNGYIEYDYLCATTLVYFFLDLLNKKIKNKINISNYLIYVLLASVCDVMPLRKLNRHIALKVLKNFNVNSNLAIKEIFNLNKKNTKLTINDLNFLVGPILNAGGRLGKSSYACELLSSNSSKIINIKANKLIELNNKRKKIESLVINEIDFRKIENENKNVIVYYKANINEGLIGIIAARLKEYFNKPAIVITNSNNLLKGSARSAHNYNIGRAIKNLIFNDIIISGGGHNMAAGFTMEKSKLQKFNDFIINDFSNTGNCIDNDYVYDGEVSSLALNHSFCKDISILEPFGAGNPEPIFLLKNLKIIKSTIMAYNHISLILKSTPGKSLNAICFNSVNTKVGKYLLNYKDNLNVLAQINENYWNNKKTLQLTIRDLIL